MEEWGKGGGIWGVVQLEAVRVQAGGEAALAAVRGADLGCVGENSFGAVWVWQGGSPDTAVWWVDRGEGLLGEKLALPCLTPLITSELHRPQIPPFSLLWPLPSHPDDPLPPHIPTPKQPPYQGNISASAKLVLLGEHRHHLPDPHTPQGTSGLSPLRPPCQPPSHQQQYTSLPGRGT